MALRRLAYGGRQRPTDHGPAAGAMAELCGHGDSTGRSWGVLAGHVGWAWKDEEEFLGWARGEGNTDWRDSMRKAASRERPVCLWNNAPLSRTLMWSERGKGEEAGRVTWRLEADALGKVEPSVFLSRRGYFRKGECLGGSRRKLESGSSCEILPRSRKERWGTERRQRLWPCRAGNVSESGSWGASGDALGVREEREAEHPLWLLEKAPIETDAVSLSLTVTCQ